MRKIRIITNGTPTSVGPLSVAQSLPVTALRYADPFVLLHHAGPQKFEPGTEAHRIEAHPHRGFEPVTYVFSGKVHHRDSLGNDGIIGAGEVQWITSGSGIIHEEGPTPDVMTDGLELELIQLWINLPASKKMMSPAYQEVHKEQIPTVKLFDDHLSLHVISGALNGASGPAHTQSPLLTAMGWFSEGGSGTLDAIAFDRLIIYVLGGEIRINDEYTVGEHQLVLFEDDHEPVKIETLSEGRLILLAGEPLNEPIFTYGPFVMSTEDEIRTAFRDYAGGKFGQL